MNRKREIYEKDEIEAVITFLKSEKNIISATPNESATTIETDTLELLSLDEKFYLETGMIVTIYNVNYTVTHVYYENNTFEINTLDEITAGKWNLAINFQFGTRPELNEILALQQNSDTMKLCRFPLFWMLPSDERKHDNLDYDFETTIKLAIVNRTDVNYHSEKRLEENIKKVLTPILKLFLEAIKSTYFSDRFMFEYKKINYTEHHRLFYGNVQKTKSVFDIPTDAIEIEFHLTFANQY